MAYDPSTIAGLQAWYKLDNGALTTDSTANGNTSTNINTVTNDTGDKQEGDASGSFVNASDQLLQILDGSLSAGFPGTGSNADFTICLWMKKTTSTGTLRLVSKYGVDGVTTNARSFYIASRNSDNVIVFSLGNTGGAGTTSYPHASALSASAWYHVSLTWEDSAKAYRIRVLDAALAVVGSDLTGTGANALNIEDAPFMIGAIDQATQTTTWQGLIDDVLVYNTVLTTDETDSIAAQLPSGIPITHYYNRQARI